MLISRIAAMLLIFLLYAASTEAQNCFVPLAKPLAAPPFDATAVALMRRYFKANLNIDGTGAIVASPGDCPALLACCNTCTGGYAYDWTRDGAISIAALQKLGRSRYATWGDADSITDEYVRDTMESYIRWVDRRTGGSLKGTEDDVYLEPKWNITTGQPYGGGWCRPQTDGPGLRAMALMQYARHHWSMRLEIWLWKIISADLDWIASRGIDRWTCDLWEETKDRDLLWNRMTMRAALIHGHRFASDILDTERASRYLHAAEALIGDPLANHTSADGGFLTECATRGSGLSCRLKRKQLDGSVILSLIHDGMVPDGWPSGNIAQERPPDPPAWPTSVVVARTVEAYNKAFCESYWINREDSAAKVPGILYGRYAKDTYGRGNPWVLITASLATLMFRAARSVVQGVRLSIPEVDSWRAALNWSGFTGSSDDFVAAGDSVLSRLRKHVEPDGFHLFEQIDKVSGRQYNARDLTWSYAEVFIALIEREEVLDLQRPISV
mmetsp:Transcript_91760/g.176587  ORF Transcript_91760/g.176587 Transcript_91760/m.176587 type:complete len:498 (-) Transcript_91760:117-1610(-)